ncbi:hypothetical protein QIS74_12903 [Colletotrichum tabaci]|uniref:Heme haloperoxidase family profile domain-containing protein n=1 Tax=Colletotrichum tabaci TaxID=1209068 RepID=A0AAV9SUV3_9PEZI
MKASAQYALWLVPYAAAFPQYANLIARAAERAPYGEGRFGANGLVKEHFEWKAPGPDDLRAPCPVMNTLANHGFIPRNGRNITRDVFIEATNKAINLDRAFGGVTFDNGKKVNPNPNATFFDLDMLHTHGIIEHDGSLSRKDSFFDPTNPFDAETFDNYLKYLGNDTTINTTSQANARARQALDMSVLNPEFEITQPEIPVIVGENAMLLSIFGSPLENPVARRDWIEFFFRNERFPIMLGWTPPAVAINMPTMGALIQEMIGLSPPDVPLTFGKSTV